MASRHVVARHFVLAIPELPDRESHWDGLDGRDSHAASLLILGDVSHARFDGTGMVLYENCSCKAGLLVDREFESMITDGFPTVKKC